jgi:2-polyprenyl-3-methyl-5-hydroxy-6-metoxy-1,4-benzoquinol methylase
MGDVSAYRFAASPGHARRTMAWYASMFHDGPVLDVGAGRGYFLEVLRGRGVECLGVDISEEAADEARGLGVEIIVEDAFSFLGQRSGFAGIFISHLIEHLEPVHTEELLRAAHKALRPGGTMVIVTPDPRDWLVLSEIFWLDPTHVRPYPTKLVVAMLEAAGFTIEAFGNRDLDRGRRHIPANILNRIRFGAHYARGEAWIRARSGT